MASRAPIDTDPSLVTNEKQTVTIDATGGTFTIAFQKDQASSPQVTAPISVGATAAQVQAALEALKSIGAGNVSVTGGPVYEIEFTDALGGRHIILLITDASLLTGGTGTAVVARTVQGQSLAGPISAADDNPILVMPRPGSDEDRTLFIESASLSKNTLVSWDGGRVWWPLLFLGSKTIVIDRSSIRGDVYAKNYTPGENFDELYVMWN